MTRLSLTARTATVVSDGPGHSGVGRYVQVYRPEENELPDLASILSATGSTSLAIVLAPPAMESRIAHGRLPTLESGRSARPSIRGVETIETVHPYAPDTFASYVGTYDANVLRELIHACERTASRIESITSSDFAWA